MNARMDGYCSQTANILSARSKLWEQVAVRDVGDAAPARATGRVYPRAGVAAGIAGELLRVVEPPEASSDFVRLPGGGVSRDQRCARPGLNLLIVDDCTLYRDYLIAAFAVDEAPPSRVAWDLESLLTELTENRPNVVLINLDARDSVMLLRATFEVCPNSKVIVLGMTEDDEAGIVACAEAGVAGYHLRTDSLDDLLDLIGRVSKGETSCSPRVSAILMRRLSRLAAQRQSESKELALTVREAQILQMLEMGLSNRDIANQLCIAVHTVKNHVHNLLAKLGVSTRAEAAARFRTVVLTAADQED
ncbi:response regulator transcription factor [Mycobacterium sp. CBMA293]|uniref:response regulator transcription factor n=1 Tax=unclassified Mycolicibacterium TaxID=2636767 RepID=UPI0012DCE781|nr:MULTISPECIES: response regulator transcription factor [unclassified Mycolicibacterium]MUL48987.1 response regulator transcription factor [Mycolicibacterium sp. CBMA 360]MUL58599.1 response regulator transcription factor [Mycolicibacterium sp. CBMA 335]MUL74057.1 response regulator transcription factor [Mycolicibacterium sp. CBMA 311]MUL93482.1 response regulator transcription factor [Mycolicibacterium sp. CBMA 230]MUM04701.1 hypothetical protein [Mycolicibacterium sp. CBMA 213]